MDCLPLELLALILRDSVLADYHGMLRLVNSRFRDVVNTLSGNPNRRQLCLNVYIKIPRLWEWATSAGGLECHTYTNRIHNTLLNPSQLLIADARLYTIRHAKLSTIKAAVKKVHLVRNLLYIDEAAQRGSVSVFSHLNSISARTTITTAFAAIRGGNHAILNRIFLQHRQVNSWAPFPECTTLHYAYGGRDAAFRDFCFAAIDCRRVDVLVNIVDHYILAYTDQLSDVQIVPDSFSLCIDHLICALDNKLSVQFVNILIPRIFIEDRCSIIRVLVQCGGIYILKHPRFAKSSVDLLMIMHASALDGNIALCRWTNKWCTHMGRPFDFISFLQSIHYQALQPDITQWMIRKRTQQQ